MDKDQNTSLQDLMRQLHHIQQEIDTHHRMKNVRKRPKRPKTVYYGVALAKKGNQGVYTDYPTVQRIKPMVWRKFTTKEKATHFINMYNREQQLNQERLELEEKLRQHEQDIMVCRWDTLGYYPWWSPSGTIENEDYKSCASLVLLCVN